MRSPTTWKPEVARLDHAGMDRADRDLVGVRAVDGDGPAREVAGVVDQRAQRLVAVEGTPCRSWASRSGHSAAGLMSTMVGAWPSATATLTLSSAPSGRAEHGADGGRAVVALAYRPANVLPAASAPATAAR